MAFHQNESKTTESIKEAKANCDTAIKEAKATCTHSLKRLKHFAPRPKPPALSQYRRPKPFAPWPSEMQRPGEPPRLAHFRNHMPSPSCTWKGKPLRRRIEVSSTSSPPVKLLYEPALQNSIVC